MAMIEHDLVPGSDEWHAFRLDHDGASECAAMLGLSKKVTRTELLHAKSTGIAKEFSDWVQKNILDYGHEVENLARPIVEKMIGKRLFPLVCSDGRPSASTDGITRAGDIAWEHKQWNKTMPAMVRDGSVPDEHMPQCQQVLMVTGAERLLFTISDGTEENMVSTEVLPDPEWFERIRAGWAQFNKEKAEYVPMRIAEKPIADAMEGLPALFVQAKGEITAHNMEAFGKSLAISLANTRSIVLVTDQDYSNAEAAAKLYRETCKKLVLVKEAVLAQATTIGEATRMIDAWHEDLRVTALKLEKDATEKKEAQKLAIITQARMAYIEHVTALELEIKPIRLTLDAPEFAAALKGKRLISAWHDAVNTLLANSKIKADAAAKDVREKLAWCKESSAGFGFLFNDLAQIITKPLEDFKLLVTSRIEAHKVAEADKLKVEREAIRIEEEAKAKAKIEAEALALAQAAAAAQKVIDDKVREKFESEEKARRIHDDIQRAKEERAKREAERGQAAKDAGANGENVTSIADKDAMENMESISSCKSKKLPTDDQTVTIGAIEYSELLNDSELLECLRSCGVDNWEGWGDAMELFEELHGERNMEQAA